jgi:hypothetical protein
VKSVCDYRTYLHEVCEFRAGKTKCKNCMNDGHECTFSRSVMGSRGLKPRKISSEKREAKINKSTVFSNSHCPNTTEKRDWHVRELLILVSLNMCCSWTVHVGLKRTLANTPSSLVGATVMHSLEKVLHKGCGVWCAWQVRPIFVSLGEVIMEHGIQLGGFETGLVVESLCRVIRVFGGLHRCTVTFVAKECALQNFSV